MDYPKKIKISFKMKNGLEQMQTNLRNILLPLIISNKIVIISNYF